MAYMLRQKLSERGVTVSEAEIEKAAVELDKLCPGERITLTGGHEVAKGCGWLHLYPADDDE